MRWRNMLVCGGVVWALAGWGAAEALGQKESFPQTKESLLNMSGMGKVKYEKYGGDFLSIIQEYSKDRKVEEKYKAPMRDKEDAGGRSMAVGKAYNAGESIEALTARYSVATDTILNHLSRFVMAGNTLHSTEALLSLSGLSPSQQQKVFAAFDELGAEMLKPIHEKLNAAVNYDELKILRLCYLCNKK